MISLKELAKEKSQLIIATHSPVLLMYPEAQIIEITQDGLIEVPYKETSIFQEWRMLFERQDHFIQQLFTDN